MSLLHIAGGATEDKLYVEDVFSTYLYTGTYPTAQTIVNGIDLATKGGMVWFKNRGVTISHRLYDTERGIGQNLASNTTDRSFDEGVASTLASFNSNGFTTSIYNGVNNSNNRFVSWTFRKAPKFFDIVTYTGDGTTNRVLSHSLGQEVGMIQSKSTSTTGNWNTYHRSATGDIALNLTNAQTASRTIIPSATSTTFTVSGVANTNGVTYVAYLYAHDPSEDGIIQCGSFTPSAGVDSVVSLGWEPQFLLVKSVVGGEVWRLLDVSRGMSLSGEQDLYPNQSNSESTLTGERFVPTATGFYHKTGTVYPDGSAVIYLAIRRPMKTPTSGTEVYNAIARTGTGTAVKVTGVSFAPDLVVAKSRSFANTTLFEDRLRGADRLLTSSTTANESVPGDTILGFDVMNGVRLGTDSAGYINATATYINHFFKRAKGFFDIVCYTGTGVARTVEHNLGVVPELMIVKSRSGALNWVVGTKFDIASYWKGYLNVTSLGDSFASYSVALGKPTSSDFTIGTAQETNNSTTTFVAYLFATLAGVSKVFAYTGNGTSLNVECGFSTGARFVLCKRTDSTGDWFVFDSVRGIVASNDPHLSLNTTAAEVTTDDSIDPYTNGFTVNQNSTTNLNVNGGTYIGLAIA